MIGAVRAPKTGELIAAHLRRKIVRGELREGDTLPGETVLMEQFDVSRPTLREAFRILETESLIEIRRGSRGARVTAPDAGVAARAVGALLQFEHTTVADVYEARAVIEPAAASLFAKRRTARQIAAMTRIADSLDETVDAALSGRESLESWMAQTLAFQDLIMEGARNRTLLVQSRVLRDILATHLALGVNETLERPALTTRAVLVRYVKSLHRFIGLIEARDAAGASAHWRAHITASNEYLITGTGDSTVLELFD